MVYLTAFDYCDTSLADLLFPSYHSVGRTIAQNVQHEFFMYTTLTPLDNPVSVG